MMNDIGGSSRSNSSSSGGNEEIEVEFGSRFVRALRKIRKGSESNNNRSMSERIKMAAYSCMAGAVGSRRAWSRAILFKFFNQRRRRRKMKKKRRSSIIILLKKKKKKRLSSRSGMRKLRKVVPGGKEMEICSLLEETAHFVKCLHSQLNIMHFIANHLTNTNLTHHPPKSS